MHTPSEKLDQRHPTVRELGLKIRDTLTYAFRNTDLNGDEWI